MELDAAVEVAEAALLGFGIMAGVCHALAVELEPGEAAVDVGVVGVVGQGCLYGLERWEILGVGRIAEGGCGVECGPAGGLRGRAGVDDGSGGWLEGRGAMVVANDVPDEDADDDEEEDVVAGAKAHR